MSEKYEMWKGVKGDEILEEKFFYDVDMSYSDTDTQKAFHSKEFGSMTIVDRMTGYGNGIRDVETGYKDLHGEFWLASGDFNILEAAKGKTIDEAISLIKKHANNLIGKEQGD